MHFSWSTMTSPSRQLRGPPTNVTAFSDDPQSAPVTSQQDHPQKKYPESSLESGHI